MAEMKSDHFHLISMAKSYARKARRNGYSAHIRKTGSPSDGYGAYVTLIKYLPWSLLTFSDPDYKSAVNYEGRLYNDPITLNYEGTKYILKFGTSDDITLILQDDTIFGIAENKGLSYISLCGINIDEKSIVADVYLSSVDMHGDGNKGYPSYAILDKSLWNKFQSLLEYAFLD